MPKKRTKTPDPVADPPAKPDIELIAIDPGDRWTGVAFFSTDDDGHWYCADAQEFAPSDFEDALAETIFERGSTPPHTVVYEKWRLYADKAGTQTGSEFLASQHIGVIKYIVRVNNEHAERHDEAEDSGKIMSCELQGQMCENPAHRPREITIVKQGAEIKKPTRGILKKKGLKSVAGPIAKAEYGNRDHVKDAELHGWYYILHTLEGTPAK